MCLLGGTWELEGKQFRVCATHPKPHTVPLLITYLLTQHSDGWGFMVCDLAYLDLTISILIKLTKKSGVTKWQRCTDLSNACPCCLNGHIKNPPTNEGDAGFIPGSGRSPGGGNGNPFQYSCWENPTDRGVWQATVHGIPKSWT